MGNEQGKLAGGPTPSGIQSMDESLQKKFSKGIQFNMKIILRGDRNTGKTALFHRMEGKPFLEAYIPTNEIQVTSILWSYKVTNDTVKVEIWDVVDKGRSQKKAGKGLLKMFNDPEEEEEQGSGDKVLDANFLDVYKGAHGVVFLFDITKQWTWQYIERELPKVPLHIPVILLANFCDMRDHRTVSKDICRAFIDHLDRPDGAADVRYAESSMKNGFGLMHLHKFLSVPFLQLQQETLLQQLQVNREQSLAALEELDSATSTEDQNYDLYQQRLQRISDEKKRKAREREEVPIGDESPSEESSPIRRDTMESISSKQPSSESPAEIRQHQQQPSAVAQTRTERSGSFKSKLTSKFSGFLSRSKEEEGKPASPTIPKQKSKKGQSSSNIDDFVPEGEVDSKFFEDEEESDEEDSEEDSDEDSDDGKPQIAGDEDFSSPEEEVAPAIIPQKTAISKQSPQTQKKSPVVKRSPKVLRSAKDVLLTDSEPEDDEGPTVMMDEEEVDFNDDRTTTRTKTTASTESTKKDNLASIPPKKPKSSGLMLEFDLSPAALSKVAAKDESPKDSPESSGRRKDSTKKKKRSKKSKNKDESDPTSPKTDSTPAAATTTAAAPNSNDPFGAIAALDAWLNSDTTDPDVSGVLQPTKVEQGVEEGKEAGEEEVDDGASEQKKPKKKKHRSGEEGGGEESSHRKKHRKSRHRKTEEESGDYDLL